MKTDSIYARLDRLEARSSPKGFGFAYTDDTGKLTYLGPGGTKTFPTEAALHEYAAKDCMALIHLPFDCSGI